MVEARLVASVLIEKEGKILLVKAKVGRPKGLWNLPGGHLDEGETFSDAAKREAKEETGLDVETGDMICIAHQNFDDSVVIVTFKSKVTAGDVSFPQDEIEEIKWFSFNEIKQLDKEKVTHSAYNSIVAFKKKRQLNYSTSKLTA